GLANKIVPRADLEKTLGEWAGRLAKMPTRAIAFTKWLTNRALETDRTGSFWDEAYAQELVTRTGDMQEGRASFIERRPPEFKGWWVRCGRASSGEPGDGRAARRSSRDRRHRADRVREGTARFGALARVPGDLGLARRRRHRAGRGRRAGDVLHGGRTRSRRRPQRRPGRHHVLLRGRVRRRGGVPDPLARRDGRRPGRVH